MHKNGGASKNLGAYLKTLFLRTQGWNDIRRFSIILDWERIFSIYKGK